MVLLFFALDLRSLSPPLLEELKQCLLQLANFYALSASSKRSNFDSSLEDRIGLCYLRRSANSGSDELKVAYSPRGRGFSLRDFHYAINHLPSDSYSPPLLDDHGSILFSGMDFSRLFSDEMLYSSGDKDIERKIVLITSSLVGNIGSDFRKTLLAAADRCVSMEFVFLEQKSSQLSDVSENIAKFKGQICDLENCSLISYLPDSQVFNGMVKRWFRELKDDTEEFLQARFVFQRNIAGSINHISCKLCSAINQAMDGPNTCKACRCDDVPSDGTDGSKCKEILSCQGTEHDTDENTMKVGEHTLLIEASWRNWTNLCQISSAVDFNVLERTSLASLSEGVVIGKPYIVIPSVCQETDAAPEENEKFQLNDQLFHGLCHALYSLNQGLVCWSFCNIETMRRTAFNYYYVLHPSDGGLMLLRRLAGAEEFLPFPDVNISDSSTAEEIDNSIQQCLRGVDLRDYNPVQHSGGFHQKFNQLVERSLQSGLVSFDSITTVSDSASSDGIGLPLQSGPLRDIAASEGETHPSNQAEEQDKGISRLTQEWEQLIVGNIARMDSLSSEPNIEKSKASPEPASQRPLDTRTSKILERLGNPKQMKSKTTSPTQVSGIAVIDQGLVTTNHLMKPTFHRLKRKYREDWHLFV